MLRDSFQLYLSFLASLCAFHVLFTKIRLFIFYQDPFVYNLVLGMGVLEEHPGFLAYWPKSSCIERCVVLITGSHSGEDPQSWWSTAGRWHDVGVTDGMSEQCPAKQTHPGGNTLHGRSFTGEVCTLPAIDGGSDYSVQHLAAHDCATSLVLCSLLQVCGNLCQCHQESRPRQRQSWWVYHSRKCVCFMGENREILEDFLGGCLLFSEISIALMKVCEDCHAVS